jgi:hypothetical protein
VSRQGLLGGTVGERDSVELVVKGVAGGAAHADVSSEPDQDHSANSLFPQEVGQIRANEPAISLLDDDEVVRLGRKSRIKHDQRRIRGKRRLYVIRVLCLPHFGPALVGNHMSDENAAYAGYAAGIEESSQVWQYLVKRRG